MEYKTLILETKDQIAKVFLNRPGIHNAFNPELIAELQAVFTKLGGDRNVRVIVLSAMGKSFCAGADLNWMKSMADFTFDENRVDALAMAAMYRTINECPKPVIGRINGTTIGGGMGLVCVCDVVVAVDSARFGFSEVKLGLSPAVISSFIVPKIGPSQARMLFLTGLRFDAAKAKEIGLVHYIVPADKLDGQVLKITNEFFTAAPGAIAAIKDMIHKLTPLELSTTLHINAVNIAERRACQEGQEGMTAFLEKRKPAWRIE